MKKAIVALLMAVGFLVNVSCFAGSEEETVSTIIKLMDNVSRTAETFDAKKALSVLSDSKDAVFFLNGKAYTKQAIIAQLTKIYGSLKTMKIDMYKPVVKLLSPDTAVWIATGKGSSITKSGKKYDESLTETWIWQKIDGKWQVIHYHETAVPAPGSKL